MENFKRLLADYKESMNHQRELDSSLPKVTNKDQWTNRMKQRAAHMHDVYMQNYDILTKVDEFLANPLTPESADILYEEVHSMYWNDYDDCQVLLPILYRLITYYEAHEDIDKLVFLYGATFYEESEIQNRRIGSHVTTANYNLKIINFASQYANLSYEKTRNRIWTAYYNLIVVELSNKVIDVDTSYNYLKEAMELWNRPDVQALDGKNPDFIRMVSRISTEWLVAEEFIETSSDETKEAFCTKADNAYLDELANNKDFLNINSEVYAAYLHSQNMQGKLDTDTMLTSYCDYCEKKLIHFLETDEISDAESYFLINAPLTLIRWLEYDISDEIRNHVVKTVMEITQDSWFDRMYSYSSPFINEIMAQWCLSIMKHMDESKEKGEFLFRVLVRRQLPTFLHSVMVSYLAEVLYEQANFTCPHLFDSLPEDAKADLGEYIKQCALLHDIGKTRITDIVNTQIRNLSDKEFQGIRQHSTYGAEIIAKDKDLSKYRDVILGHHKFYDGTSGYPANFNNTTSPYRIIIDLITICDCIDAASDNLGRNYRSAKTFEQVLAELEAEKGTRYNPQLVDVIKNSPRLQRQMRYIVNDGRLNLMHYSYTNHMT